MDELGIEQDWGKGGIEPPLQELMSDPIMHLLLQRDGLTSEAVWRFLEQARDRLGKTGRDVAPIGFTAPQPATYVQLRLGCHEGRI